MNRKSWQTISIIFSLVVGSLLHFTYEWSGQNILVGTFSAVNESVWEHLKLAFFPMLVIAIAGYFIFGKNVTNYAKGKSIGIIFAIAFITVFFYTYTGIIGKSFLIVDIGTFIVAVIAGELIADKIITKGNTNGQRMYVVFIGILLLCFVVFTFLPPHINYFKDPVTNIYGIQSERSA